MLLSFDFDKIYKDVPQEQKEDLIEFRFMYPYEHLCVAGTQWNYLSCGQGEQTLLLLPGGLRLAETAFRLIMAFEDEYHIIVPTYPPLATVSQLLDGIADILEAEYVQQASVFGASFGGAIAQCFVRTYPGKVNRLILANTGVPPTAHEVKLLRRVLKVLPHVPSAILHTLAKLALLRILSTSENEQAFWYAYLNELFAYYITKEDILSYFEEILDWGQNWTFSPADLSDWPGEVLILESSRDAVIKPPEQIALKTLYPQARVHTFHNAGHTPWLSHQEEYVARIKDFLKEQERVKPAGKIPLRDPRLQRN